MTDLYKPTCAGAWDFEEGAPCPRCQTLEECKDAPAHDAQSLLRENAPQWAFRLYDALLSWVKPYDDIPKAEIIDHFLPAQRGRILQSRHMIDLARGIYDRPD